MREKDPYVLVFFQLVDSDAGVGTNLCARCATDARLRLYILTIGIALVIDLTRGEGNGACRTGDDTEIASLATLDVYCHSSVDFSHGYVCLFVYRSLLVYLFLCVKD